MSGLDNGSEPTILVCYGSSEGQTATVARRMRTALENEGHRVTLVDAAAHPADLEVGSFDGVIVGASIHGGSHQRPVTEFVRTNVDVLNRAPSAFFSVSLTAARETPAQRAPARGYIEEFLETTGWDPDATLVVAGALKYSQYGRLKRLLMRFLAGRSSGDTDTSRDYEYTDWEDVESFAREFATLLEPPTGSTG
ncbi:flavodoxin domain-containing protein [Natrarchaeobaculum sulfurireducens]|uniref:Protoporphyrinogen IX oxidase, menaquinone-dependent (Flavodoxin domain) n=1 Tax=Natrarchaeobaculum sulfurireducens TaxID=2044521 RepID=A0A346PAL5_9EURY|nr:flavodoxin domain-containing protein [Natrarchaeobaculum sulfurireducens]AXR76560.1 Protoporphyrinogen IX oxidase, menaquinone-dependent (flavodoxin domain) [Natrarchaeobaculum sulfurireducens]AXR80237.1 Protoporphyrinogen IX oxidase, oxygen-independent, HemG [Natrarchaeobaculum sulfurireducens]